MVADMSNAYLDGWTESQGRKAGCLPRVSKPGQYFPLASERIKIYSDGEIREKIAERKAAGLPTLRSCVKEVLDQDGRGSCAWEGLVGALMGCRVFDGYEHVLLAPWFGYGYTNRTDSGSSIDENLKVAMERGVAPMELHPRSLGWRATPSQKALDAALEFRPDEVFDITNDQEFRSALVDNFFVPYGRDGHAIVGTGLEDFDDLEFLNSWGTWTNCGIPGFGREKLSRSVNYNYGAYALRSTTTDNSVPTIKRVSELPPMFEPYPQFDN